jgi:prepilin-type N-terminal cleavage/methylation domain-containing protein
MRRRPAFTLIELLTVIAIIGILAAVLFPGVSGVMKAAKKSAAQTQLVNIGKGYQTFTHQGFLFVRPGAWSLAAPAQAATISDYAAVLAYHTDLNDGLLWYVDADPANEIAIFPKQVLVGEGDSRQVFSQMTAPSAENGYISWSAYSPTVRGAGATTPLVWTRGLGTDGKWAALDGVWGSEGGHIVFGDGHVVWVANTADPESRFVDRVTPGATTENWKRAVGAALFAGTELKSR